MTKKIIKMKPSDMKAIRQKRGDDTDTSLSGDFRDALAEYGNGRARKPQLPERFTEQVNVYADDVVFARASERARAEKRPIGEAIAEILLR